MRALLLLLTACAAASPTRPPAKMPVVAQATPPPCPLDLDGATVEVKEVAQGVALEFTSYEDVAELRRRVRLFADIRNADTNHRLLENVDGGVQVIFPPELSTQIAALGRQMEGGACPASLPIVADERVVAR